MSNYQLVQLINSTMKDLYSSQDDSYIRNNDFAQLIFFLNPSYGKW